ncbi:programmed cell death protein 2 [Pyronema domesticum]|nr:programmed cell death protein 2 [Pyronema domesticum]
MDSDEDIQDYTETTVLLGYAEEDPVGNDTASHLGGAPTWLAPTSPADARLAKCTCCNNLMTLLLQLDGNLKDYPHERMFYVFSCPSKTCRRKPGSVKALRAVKVSKDWEERQKKDAEEKAKKEAEKKAAAAAAPRTGDMLFGGGGFGGGMGGANPFATAGAPANPFSTGGASANPFAAKPAAPAPAPAAPTPVKTLEKTFAESLNISKPAEAAPEPLLYGPVEPWPTPLPHQYPNFYLDADYETLAPEEKIDVPKIQEIIEEADNAGDAPVSSSDADDGVLDTTFQKFADRVGQNPEQVLRYERGGQPLLYSDSDEVAKLLLEKGGKECSMKRVPACKGCGKRDRQFEFQLMPHAIAVLEGDSMSLEGMEWGTIIVGTCNCTPKARDGNGVGWCEEWVGVQWEGQK